MMKDARLLTIPEVAIRLGLKPSTIRKMVLNRTIDVIRPSVRAVRIPESAVTRILERGFRPAVEVKGICHGR